MTREQWLEKAIDVLREELEMNFKRTVKVSCGWPSKKALGVKSRALGQCFNSDCSGAGYNEIFVSPFVDHGAEVLAILAHEMIHAEDDCKSGHKDFFKAEWKRVGFEGKPTGCTPGEDMQQRLNVVLQGLGDYPHRTLDATVQAKKQGTRMIKLVCLDCGYVVRTTKQWIDTGLPICVCGREFNIEEV